MGFVHRTTKVGAGALVTASRQGSGIKLNFKLGAGDYLDIELVHAEILRLLPVVAEAASGAIK